MSSTDALPPASAKNFGDRMRQWALVGAGLLGDRMDSFVRVRDLQDAGIAGVHERFVRGAGGPALSGIGFAVGDPYEIDLTPPPTPTGLLVTAGITKLVIQCDPALYRQGHGHDRTIVYGATYSGTGPLPTFATAVELSQFPGTVTDYATNPATEWHIWIKWRTKDGVLSAAPAGGTNGFTVTTGQDVSLLLNALTAAAQAPAAPYTRYAVRAGLFYVANDTSGASAPLFSVVGAPITVNGVVVPVGVYMQDAYIMNGTITNAKMANLAVDTAKIADLAVSTAKMQDLSVNTAKMADLAVTNAKIAALAVGTANIQDLAVTNAKMGNAAVDTLQIAGNAVTVPVAAELASSVPITAVSSTAGAGSMNSVLSLSIDSAGQPILITATCNVVSFGTDGITAGKSGNMAVGIFVDGGLVKYGYVKSSSAAGASGDARLVMTKYLPAPGAGAHTIEVRMQVWDTGIAAGVTYYASASGDLSVNSGNTLVAMGLKR